MKKIDWKKVKFFVALYTLFGMGIFAMMVIYALVERITPCEIC
jgi:hypothetical protein